MQIRKAEINDIAHIMRIEEESFSEGIRENELTFMERIETFSEGFLLLVEEEQIIGYIASEIWKDSEGLERERFTLGHSIKNVHEPKGTVLYISSMGTRAAERGKGHGTRMFTYLMEQLPKQFPHLERCILLVNENWKAARRIYQKQGFCEVGILEFFFNAAADPSESGVIMEKYLSFIQNAELS